MCYGCKGYAVNTHTQQFVCMTQNLSIMCWCHKPMFTSPDLFKPVISLLLSFPNLLLLWTLFLMPLLQKALLLIILLKVSMISSGTDTRGTIKRHLKHCCPGHKVIEENIKRYTESIHHQSIIKCVFVLPCFTVVISYYKCLYLRPVWMVFTGNRVINIIVSSYLKILKSCSG